jgi:hypothetical protein
VEVSRHSGLFDSRWPCVLNDVRPAAPDSAAVPRARLTLVPSVYPMLPNEEAGTRRLMAAMAAEARGGGGNHG